MKRIFLYAMLLATITQVGCSKQLELRPTDSIDQDEAYTSVDDLQEGLLGVYAVNDQTNKIYIGSLLADEVKLSNENRGQGQFTYKWQFSSGDGEVTLAYRQYYTMIDRIHRALSGAAGVNPTIPADIDRKNRIVSELTALKAIAYYESLINVMPPGYEPGALGIALVNESCLLCAPARNTVAEVVTEIQTLLATARTSTQIPNSSTDPVRLSKAAIAAYQARVALLKEDYPAAVTFATDAITLSGKALAAGADYEAFWYDENEAETIWKYRNANLVRPRVLWRDTNGDVFFEPSQKLKDSYDKVNDIRYTLFFTALGNDTSVVNKYPGSQIGPNVNDLKLIRLSEMYLLRAEANARNNKPADAATDVNAIRAVRLSNYAPISYTTQSQAEDGVLLERFKELCFEGFRFYDLKRNMRPVNRPAFDVQSTQWQNLEANDYRFTLPIPQDAVNSNPNTEQNTGY